MAGKTQQLQIRVTPQQKLALRRLARTAGLGVSAYVLSRLVPDQHERFEAILRSLDSADDHRYALAELNDFLTACPPLVFADAVALADLGDLGEYLRNYVAAMVEQAAGAKHVAPPDWTRRVAPLATPHFVTPIKSLRMHLLRSAPVAFKRRNIFIDAAVGDRV